MRYKLVDAEGTIHGYSHNKAKLHRYLNDTYPSQGATKNVLSHAFEIVRVKAGELNG